MRAVALVPAPDLRGTRPFLGRPLALWAVEAAARCGAIDRVLVATDDPAVRAALPPGVETLGSRDQEARTSGFDAVIRLGPESPLTRPEEIRAALDRYLESHADSLVSVARPQGRFWGENGSWLEPLAGAPLIENGAILIARPSGLPVGAMRPVGRIAFYEMSAESLWEPDDPACRRAAFDRDLRERLLEVRLVLSDVDGVMTDAGMVYGEGGDELKRFNTRDGKGFEIVRGLGLKTGIVTTENTALVARRAKKLRVDFLYQGIERKHESLGTICGELGIAPAQVAYIGDDVNDLSILREVGFAACPADAVDEVKALAHYVCRTKGGEGAVRELCDLIASAYQSRGTDGR